MFKNFIKINKLAAVLIMALGGIFTAMADNKIMLDNGGPIAIKPGETKVVAVNFENDDEFAVMQFDMELTSSKISIVDNSLKVNNDRVDRELFTTSLYHMDNGKWRFAILTRGLSINPIEGHTGALAYFTIKAADDFTKDDGAKIYYSTSSGADVNAQTIKISTPNYQAVTPLVGSLSLGETAFSIKPGGMHRVDVALTNVVELNGLQTDITLPEGLTIEEKAKGGYKFEYSDRLSDNFTISSQLQKDGKVRVVLSSLPIDKISGNEGTLFSFNVVADKNFVTNENSVISFSNTLAAADNGAIEYSLETENAKAVVTSLKAANDAAYARLSEEVAALQKSLDDAKAKVAEEFKDVAGNYAETVEAIQKQIEAIMADLDTKNENCDLTAESVLDAEAVKAVKEAVEKYVADAQAAQAEVVKKAANDEAYAKLSAEVKALTEALVAAQAKVAEECKDVAADFEAVPVQIAEQITAIQTALDAKYAAIELTAESTLDAEAVKAVNDAIANYVADAQAAQKKFEEDKKAYEEKVAANEEAYKRLSEEIAAVQARFDEVKTIIDEKYSNVAGQFGGTEMTIQLEINRVSKELQAQYENVELTAESQLDLQVLKETIEQLLNDAKKASETTGIGGVWMNADGAECIGVYTLDGAKVEAPVKGQLYILRYADGKTMKVFMK